MTWPVALASAWHPIAYTDEVGRKPRPVRLMGRPLAVFRASAGFGVLEDRCPHRNAPLSMGRVVDGAISCPYHGWTFAGDGQCIAIPGSAICPEVAARSFPVVERAGLIWTSLADAPSDFPDPPSEIEDRQLDGFWWHLTASRARVLDAIENLLDPMHPYYLHPGLVRAAKRPGVMDVDVRIDGRGCEASYVEHGRSMTFLARLFEGERTQSIGRYLAPATVQIAFADAKGPTVVISVVFTPEDESVTRPYAHFATRKGLLPAWLKRHLVIAFHAPVIAQDRVMLARQTDTIAEFGGPQFTNGPLDFFGPSIWRLVNGQPQPSETHRFQIIP